MWLFLGEHFSSHHLNKMTSSQAHKTQKYFIKILLTSRKMILWIGTNSTKIGIQWSRNWRNSLFRGFFFGICGLHTKNCFYDFYAVKQRHVFVYARNNIFIFSCVTLTEMRRYKWDRGWILCGKLGQLFMNFGLFEDPLKYGHYFWKFNGYC